MRKFFYFGVFLLLFTTLFILDTREMNKNKEQALQWEKENELIYLRNIERLKNLEEEAKQNPKDDKLLFDLAKFYIDISMDNPNNVELLQKGLYFMEKSAELGNTEALVRLSGYYRPKNCDSKDKKLTFLDKHNCDEKSELRFKKIQNQLKEKGIIVYRDRDLVEYSAESLGLK